MAESAAAAPDDSFFLPDFCSIRVVFAVVVACELLAFVLVLAGRHRDPWSELALVSLFVQWVGLSSAALLCVTRGWLRSLPESVAAALSYVLVLAVTLALSEAAWWLVEHRLVNLTLAGREHLEFSARNLAIGAIVSLITLRYFYVSFQWRQGVESEARARIQALQSRIRPHFLFNSMNTIASLVRSRPQLAEQAVEDLADLFRVSLGDAQVPVTLARELEVCRQYLGIEQLRLGERLSVEWQVDDLPADALLPALILQPLLENAVYHGIEAAPTGGSLRLRGERKANALVLELENTLPESGTGGHRDGNRLAQDNVRQRLRAFFDAGARMLCAAEAGTYRVRIEFPYRKGRA